MRWILLEELVVIEKGRRAHTRSRVPAWPVSPEFLMLEMMAQTGGLLMGAEEDFKRDVVFSKVEHAAFEFLPQEQDEWLDIIVCADQLRAEGGRLQGQVKNGERLRASASIMLADAGHSIGENGVSVTFPAAFLDYLQVREKIK